jgi:hypothetical protein
VSAETAVRAVLLADATVAALVGDRIYPKTLPQDVTLPAITYQRISTIGDLDLDGDQATAAVRVQLNLWSESYDGVCALARAVCGDDETGTPGALLGYSGDTGQGVLQLVRLANLLDAEEPEWKPGVTLHGKKADFFVHVKGVAV